MKRRTQFFLQANGKVVSDQMVTMRKSEVDQLVAEVNALREDKGRLDWLDENLHIDLSRSTSEKDCYYVFFPKDLTPRTGLILSVKYVSLRAAINAARKEAQP